MRKLIALPIVLALSLGMAGSVAAASGPEVTRQFLQFPSNIVVDDCGTFQVIATQGSRDRLVHRWHDETGNVTLERFRVHFDITLRNSVTGTTATYTGQFVFTYDAVEQTAKFRGAYRKLQIDGRVVLSASGHTLWDDSLLPGDTLVFVHGKSSIDQWHAELCSAMNR